MDKFATLEPVRLYGAKHAPVEPKIGRFTRGIHTKILQHLPIPDIPAFARCSRATAALVRDDTVWAYKWATLDIDNRPELVSALDLLDKAPKPKFAPAVAPDDDFGDFAAADPFAASATAFPVMPSLSFAPTVHQNSAKARYMRLHRLLKPLLRILSSPPHLVIPQIAEATSPALIHQATTLRLLSLFLSPSVQPVRRWQQLYMSLRAAMDRFESTLLAAFELADSQNNEAGMKEAAESSWNVRDSSMSDWEMGKVWVEKREIFYQQGNWQPLDNFTSEDALDFDAMDSFMDHILSALQDHGSRAVRVFPPESHVLLLFSERLSNEVVGDYITTLLAHARQISIPTYLTSTAASFKEAWRVVDALLAIAAQRTDSKLTRSQAEDIVFHMFEPNMDEYLDEEVENVKSVFDRIIKRWNQTATSSTQSDAAFLHSQNPALVKRNVLTSFTNLLLLPVTLVPRTVGAVGGALITGGTAAVQGITMLNPQRWASRSALESGPPPEPVPAPVDLDQSADSTPAGPVPAQQLDLLLSLDVALELIHADREALKRLEVFTGYPSHCGQRVQDTIEEIFILVLQALGNQHISPGFEQAIAKMKAYKPAEHTEISKVAPLVQFFELVHIGDMIQSMIQVYFDKEIALHIDKTDFLNTAVREKKRFENALDDLVAGGLNAGTDTLMTQVDHIINTLTKPREYYPSEDDSLDLGPTEGCLTAIQCLDAHCKLLKGSTSKEVLEVFYQEIGMRLLVILQKHIKRHIISLNGGFQIISDLNAYNTFINTFKIPALNSEFAHLKMLGHVYIVEDAKDLAQIVRDVARYGGAYKPEDIYEFIQRRSDWKQIEKTVDKTMYSLSFKEDCIIC